MSKISGGQAFPKYDFLYDDGEKINNSEGMTLRDYFAAAALQSSLIDRVDKRYEYVNKYGNTRFVEEGFRLRKDSPDEWSILETPLERISRKCYEIADSMLDAREENA